ncbi:MAG: META domain-containing protein [Flavobacteriales bacterium]|nr:META domain-containing protein [Flavobacteriales bacterium]
MKLQLPLAALALGVVLSANTCTEKSASTSGAQDQVPGKWVLATLNGAAVEMPEGKEMPFLSIDSLGVNVNGYAGCNRVFGTMKVWGDSIAFPGLAATRMYCQETQQVEDRFLQALNEARTYQVDGSKLVLFAGKEVAVLQRAAQ